MVKNLIFDMGGVLIKWEPDGIVGMWDLPEEDHELLVNKIFKSWHWPLLDYGYYADNEAFLSDVLPEIPERLRSVATDIVNNWRKRYCFDIDGMAAYLEELKGRGYGIYLLSNAGTAHSSYWASVAGHEFFDGIMVSAFEKQYKPCTDIFKTLLLRFNLKACECVFIDDMNTNCAAAFMCGIKPVVFTSCNQLRKDLEPLLQ